MTVLLTRCSFPLRSDVVYQYQLAFRNSMEFLSTLSLAYVTLRTEQSDCHFSVHRDPPHIRDALRTSDVMYTLFTVMSEEQLLFCNNAQQAVESLCDIGTWPD